MFASKASKNYVFFATFNLWFYVIVQHNTSYASILRCRIDDNTGKFNYPAAKAGSYIKPVLLAPLSLSGITVQYQ